MIFVMTIAQIKTAAFPITNYAEIKRSKST